VLIGVIVEKQSGMSCRMVENRKAPEASGGLRNKITRELIERVEATGILLLTTSSLCYAAKPPRESGMTAAAPLVYPKLAAVKMSGDKDAPLFDLSASLIPSWRFCGRPS
jgi:hypothetical protein